MPLLAMLPAFVRARGECESCDTPGSTFEGSFDCCCSASFDDRFSGSHLSCKDLTDHCPCFVFVSDTENHEPPVDIKGKEMMSAFTGLPYTILDEFGYPCSPAEGEMTADVDHCSPHAYCGTEKAVEMCSNHDVAMPSVDCTRGTRGRVYLAVHVEVAECV